MNEIHWDDSYSVGVPRLDEQHKRIVGVVNLLVRNAGVTVVSETISEALTRLTRYANEHFVTEEEMLRKHNYLELEDHLKLHKEYRAVITTFCQETWALQPDVPKKLSRYVSVWWWKHVLVEDMKYKAFFEKLGVRG